MSKWIAMTTRKPPYGQPVLVSDHVCAVVAVRKMTDADGEHFEARAPGLNGFLMREFFTHWMALPALPPVVGIVIAPGASSTYAEEDDQSD